MRLDEEKLEKALKEMNSNKTRLAKQLEVSRQTIDNWCAKKIQKVSVLALIMLTGKSYHQLIRKEED